MSKVIKRYRLLRELPMYSVGTIVVHEYEVLPSQFRQNETYKTDGEWYTEERGRKIHAPKFLSDLVDRCALSFRDDTVGWVEEVGDE